MLATTAGIILGYYYLGRKKKFQVTLLDPTVKYQLRLIDKEVDYFCRIIIIPPISLRVVPLFITHNCGLNERGNYNVDLIYIYIYVYS